MCNRDELKGLKEIKNELWDQNDTKRNGQGTKRTI